MVIISVMGFTNINFTGKKMLIMYIKNYLHRHKKDILFSFKGMGNVMWGVNVYILY